MNHLSRDLKYAWRVFRKSPGFTLIAVLTLAFGIGANTAVFSVVDSVLLRPLPFPEPEELIQVWSQFPSMEFFEFWLSQPEYEALKEEIDSFEVLGAYSFGGRNLSRDGITPVRITVSLADQDFFETLGLNARVGRTFSAEEDSPGGNPAAILSYPLWRDSFGADSSVIGQSIFLDGVKTDVVGVMPPGITVVSGSNVDAWLPMQLDHANPRPRGNHFIRVLGRLKQGRTFDQAQAEIETWLAAADPNQHVLNTQFHPVLMVPLHEQITGDVRTALILLLGAVTFVLLICCVNVANLFLARAGARRREIAVRSAMGAGRRRLVSQLLSESALIALAGGVLGYAIARLGVGLLLALNPSSLPRDVELSLDPRILIFTLGVSMLTGLVFGLAPALQTIRTDLNQTLKDGGRGGAEPNQTGGRKWLVTAEIALSLVLVVGAGLMIRSFVAIQGVEAGFNPENRLALRVFLPSSDYPTNEGVLSFYHRLEERMQNLPGVRSATVTSNIPMRSTLNANDFQIEGFQPGPQTPPVNVDFQKAITPSFFGTLEVELKQGRLITEQDRADGKMVVVVSESLVKRFFPVEDPLGRRIRASSSGPWAEIVGVVGNVKEDSLEAEFQTHMYFPLLQNLTSRGFVFRGMDIVLHTDGDPLSLIPTVRRTIASMDPKLPVADVQTMEELLGSSLDRRRFTVALLACFAVLSLGLAAIGIYGVMAYSVSQRTGEIGIRMALGAARQDVLSLIFRQGVIIVLAGVAVGVVASLLLTRLMGTLLYQVSLTDPATYMAVLAVLLAVAALASFIPARRASRVDPMVALRAE